MDSTLFSSPSNLRSLVDSLRTQLAVVQPSAAAAERCRLTAFNLELVSDFAIDSKTVDAADASLKR